MRQCEEIQEPPTVKPVWPGQKFCLSFWSGTELCRYSVPGRYGSLR